MYRGGRFGSGEKLRGDDRPGVTDSRSGRRQKACGVAADVGPGDDERAEKAQTGRREPKRGKPFPENQSREQHHPDLRGEFEREELRERNEVQSVEPEPRASRVPRGRAAGSV